MIFSNTISAPSLPLMTPLGVARLSSIELARAVRRAATTASPPNLEPYKHRCLELMNSHTMEPVDLVSVVFSFGIVHEKDEVFLRTTSMYMIPYLSALSLSDLSKLLAGFARVGVRSDALFDLACREIARKTPSNGTLTDLGNVLYSLATLKYTHPLLVEIIGKRIANIAPRAAKSDEPNTARDFTKIVHALANMDGSSEKILAIISTEICRIIDKFPPFALAQILQAYTRKGLSNQFLVDVVVDESCKQKKLFEVSDAGVLLDGLVRANCDSGKKTELFEFFINTIPKKGFRKLKSPEPLALIAAAVAEHSPNNSPEVTTLFMAIGDKVAELADLLNHRHITQLVHAFATVGVRHGPLLFNAPDHVAAAISQMSIEEIASIMNSYANLEIRNETLLGVCPPRVKELLNHPRWDRVDEGDGEEDGVFAISHVDPVQGPVSESEVTAAVQLIHAYAKLMVNERDMLVLAADRIAKHSHLLSPAAITDIIPKAFSILGIQPQKPLVDLISSKESTSEYSAIHS
jgi:hypothetical protein